MSLVFVLSADRKPLDPCHPARARKLLKSGQAAAFRLHPFTIILKERTAAGSTTHEHRLKIDPGSKVTGMAVLCGEKVVWAAELQHRGSTIKKALDQRRGVRRGRRHRHCRYRPPRFNNRRKPEGWLPPSLQSRVENVRTWVKRLRRYCPITTLSMELAKFDTQAMQNPEISGVEYQRGELFGYEVRAYLLEKFGHKCAYCGAESVPLQVEHIIPKGRGGSDRVSNLTIACEKCNVKKGVLTATEFGHPAVQEIARQPLKDAAALNATRWAIWGVLAESGMPLEVGTGGRTRWNRSRLGLEKSHWIDAACVGESTPLCLNVSGMRPLLIRAKGHGARQMCQVDKYGFPKSSPKAKGRLFGFRTGDIVLALNATGKHFGRVVVRKRGSFQVGKVDGVSWRCCHVIQKADGYGYLFA